MNATRKQPTTTPRKKIGGFPATLVGMPMGHWKPTMAADLLWTKVARGFYRSACGRFTILASPSGRGWTLFDAINVDFATKGKANTWAASLASAKRKARIITDRGSL